MSSPRFLGITQSVCPVCRSLVPAKLIGIEGDLYFEKFCPVHGQERVFVRADIDDYIQTLRYVKPATKPLVVHGDMALPCPEGCGFCEHHEQHLCLPIIEITKACDMACPICLVSAHGDEKLTEEAFSFILDRLLEAEPQVDVLNLSGGEPLTHPDLLRLLDNALQRPEIVRVSISTNGLRLLKDEALLRELKGRDVIVSLQFDGFDDEIYRTLRGRPLLKEKQMVLDRLLSFDITTSLTMTAMRDVNEDAFAPVLELLFSSPNIVSLMIQPMVYEGRGRNMPLPERRLTLPEVVHLLQITGQVDARDFTPLPCSHPACFSLAFYLMVEGGRPVSVNELFDAATWLDTIANRGIFGLDEDRHENIKDRIYELWSGPAAANPESQAVLNAVRDLLRDIGDASTDGFHPHTVFSISERKIKSIFIHAFQDADTFDLARVRRCCNGYPQKDGQTIPACVYNVFRRHRPPSTHSD